MHTSCSRSPYLFKITWRNSSITWQRIKEAWGNLDYAEEKWSNMENREEEWGQEGEEKEEGQPVFLAKSMQTCLNFTISTASTRSLTLGSWVVTFMYMETILSCPHRVL